MIRIAGRLHTKVYYGCGVGRSGSPSVVAFRTYSASKETPPVTSMKIPLGERDDAPPSQTSQGESRKRGGRLKYLLGGVVIASAAVLYVDENTRLAAVEAVPATKPVFEFFNLSTSAPKKLIPAPRAAAQSDLPSRNTRTMEAVAGRSTPITATPEKVADCKKDSVQHERGFSVIETASQSVAQFKTPPDSPADCPSRPPARRDNSEKGTMLNVADNSVRFLLSGKRADDIKSVDCRPVDADSQRAAGRRHADERECAEQQRRDSERVMQERRGAEAASEMERKRRGDQKREEILQAQQARAEDNLAMESALSYGISDLVSCAADAVRCNNSALCAAKQHSELLRRAMLAESNQEAQEYWDDLKEVKELRNIRKEEARAASCRVQGDIEHFLHVVDAARKHPNTGSNPALASYRSQAVALLSDVDVSTALLENAQSVGDALAVFYQHFQRDRRAFQNELLECVPGAMPVPSEGVLKNEEMRELIAQAHRRIYQLKKQVHESELLADQRAADALRDQSERNSCDYQAALSDELCRQRHRCDADLKRQLDAETVTQEEAIRTALGSQALELNKQLRVTLNTQLYKMMEEYEGEMKERLLHERQAYLDKMAESTAVVEGLMSALTDKTDVDKTVARVRDLVTTSRKFLHDIVKADSSGGEKVDVRQSINRLRRLSADSEFVNVITCSIPATAYEGGVYTKSALQSRFNTVLQQCKKVAKLPGSNNIFSQTVNSVYNTLFSWDGAPTYTRESDFESNANCMSTTELLIQANYFMKNGCVGAAVKCLVQLEDIPRAVAQDWIAEARGYLEARQAADALYTYALSQLMSTVI